MMRLSPLIYTLVASFALFSSCALLPVEPAHAAAQFCTDDAAFTCAPDFNFNESPSVRRWINENVNRINAAMTYHEAVFKLWASLDGLDLQTRAARWALVFPQMIGFCEVLDHDLRGTTGRFDALPRIAGRGCHTPAYDTVSKIPFQGGVDYMFHQMCDDAQGTTGTCSPRPQESEEYFSVNAGVKITPQLREIIRAVAFDFYLSAGQRLVITSGFRGWYDQAVVWTDDEPQGKGWYPLTAADVDDITKTYNKSGGNPWIPKIIAQMQSDTDAGVTLTDARMHLADMMMEADLEGHPVTKHHYSLAFDVRIMPGLENDFIEAALGSKFYVIDKEGNRKDHWHAQFGPIKKGVQSPTQYRGGATY